MPLLGPVFQVWAISLPLSFFAAIVITGEERVIGPF